MKKNNVALLIISLIAIASMLGYVSYSIIAMGITNDEYNVFATASNGLVFTAEGGGNFNNNVTDDNMTQGEENKVVVSTSDTVNVTLETDGQKGICCSYDIEWIWDEDSKNQYTLSTGANNEFVLEGQFTTSYNAVGGETVSVSSDGTGNFTKQVPNYNAEDKKMHSGNICNTINAQEKTISTKVTQSYTLQTKFYNLKDINQDALKGKTFKGHIQISNVKCTKSNDAA